MTERFSRIMRAPRRLSQRFGLGGLVCLLGMVVLGFLCGGCGPRTALKDLDLSDSWRLAKLPPVPYKLSPEIRILIWNSYIPPAVIAHFEQRYRVKVHVEYHSENEELYAKVTKPGASYDLVMPGTYMVQQLIREGKLRPIERTHVPNVRHVQLDYFSLKFDPGLKYSVPIFQAAVGVALNFKYASGLPLTWPEFLEEYGQPLALGRFVMMDEMRASLGVALLMLGFSPNTQDAAEIAKARDLLIDIKAKAGLSLQVDRMPDVLANEEVILGSCWSGDAAKALSINGYVRFIVPRGLSITDLDSLCVPTNAKAPETAEFFINYLLVPEITGALSNYSYYANSSYVSRAFMNAEIANGPCYMVPLPNNAVFLEDVGSARKHYQEAWNAVKQAPSSKAASAPLPFPRLREKTYTP